MSRTLPIHVVEETLASFCTRWQVRELALFGSILRDDFGPGSDVDVLVEFDDAAPWSLWDLIEMRDELSRLFGRPVDLVEKKAIKNPFRRHHILKNVEVIYSGVWRRFTSTT
jgi:uncharacterized protein